MGCCKSKIKYHGNEHAANKMQTVKTSQPNEATTSDRNTNAEPVNESNGDLESDVPLNQDPSYLEQHDEMIVKTTNTVLEDDTKNEVSKKLEELPDASIGVETEENQKQKKKEKKKGKKKKKKNYLKEVKNKQESWSGLKQSGQQESRNLDKKVIAYEANTHDTKRQTMPVNPDADSVDMVTSPSNIAWSEGNEPQGVSYAYERRFNSIQGVAGSKSNDYDVTENKDRKGTVTTDDICSQKTTSRSTVTASIRSQGQQELKYNDKHNSVIQKKVKDPEKEGDEQTKPQDLPDSSKDTTAENGQEITHTKAEISVLKKKAKYEQKIDSLIEEVEKKTKLIAKYEQELATQKEELKKKQRAMYEQEIKSLKEDVEKKKKSISKYEKEVAAQKEEIRELKKKPRAVLAVEVDVLRKENVDLKNRMSRMMSDRLTDNNPNITDLSDQNRPNKLSERFGELYNNEWTDALEELTSTNVKPDIEAIKLLLHLIMTIFHECRRIVGEDMASLTEAVLRVTKSTQMTYDLKLPLKVFKDIRKKNYRTSIKPSDEFVQSLLPCDVQMTEHVKKYILLGYEICWLMCIQDPPLYLSRNVTKDAPFDKIHFREYTKSGELNDYAVWPVLFLHENGPILQKGVMQPKKEKKQVVKTR